MDEKQGVEVLDRMRTSNTTPFFAIIETASLFHIFPIRSRINHLITRLPIMGNEIPEVDRKIGTVNIVILEIRRTFVISIIIYLSAQNIRKRLMKSNS